MSIEDKFAIKDLNLRFAAHIDCGDVDAWVATFTAEGIFDLREINYGLHMGHDQIRAHGHNTVTGPAQVVHLMFNHLLSELTDDKAIGTVSGLAEGVSPTGGRYRLHVTYEDEYTKVAGDWKFSRRIVRQRLPPETVDQSQILTSEQS